MSECLNSAIKEFKYAVIKPVKFYNKIKNIPEYSNITYSQFRTKNISFDIFETAFLNIDNNNIISISQIRNMFKYLSQNIRGNRDSDIKRAVIKIEKLRIALVMKYNKLDPVKDEVAIKNIDDILIELRILKSIILEPLKNKDRFIEKEIQFEMLADELLHPETFEDSTLLTTLFYNLPTLTNSPNNGKRFNEKLYKVLLENQNTHDSTKRKYYITLANLVKEANIYRLDKKVMNICGFNKYADTSKSILSKKISTLDYNTDTGRYRIDDYIVTIDNENTSKFDDAISIEKASNGSYILGIHIADVYSLGITPLSNESLEFKSQASLKENIDKNAISLFVEISNTGLILDKKMLMTNITVNNNLLYDDVTKIISNRHNDKLCQTVIDLIGLYNIVENSKLPDFPGPSKMAHALVQKYMLLYGCLASDMASKTRAPILYQVDSDKRSEVSLEEVYCNTGFDDNNLTTYARFTSPIWDLRSYINQTSICQCIFDRIDYKEKSALRLKISSFKNEINKANNHNSLQE